MSAAAIAVFLIGLAVMAFPFVAAIYIASRGGEITKLIFPMIYLPVFGGVIAYASGIIGFLKSLRLYKLANTDKEQYLKVLTDLERKEKQNDTTQDERIKNTQIEISKMQSRLNHTPACPICGSKHHVVRISSLDRTVSTAVWGAASSSIGKQWECTSCNHKFNVDVVAPAQEPVRADPEPQPDVSEELRKYKQLLDDGLITQEDYDTKKRQLLGL